MAVNFKSAGAFLAGTGAITPLYPTSPAAVANDIALLVITSENQAISLTTANGFALLGSATSKAAGTAATNPASLLVVYWKRCDGTETGSTGAPVVADSLNNTEGQIYIYSGAKISGNPWDVYAEGNDAAANDTSATIPTATTTVANTLVVLISSTSYNATSTAEFSGWTNANLGSITERGDNSNTAGLGGGHGLADGTWASTGAYGYSTVTLAHTTYKGTMSIALAPEVSPTVALNTPSDTATGVSTTPDLLFTGTDLNADEIEYNVQVDTVNTFDSHSAGVDLSYVEANWDNNYNLYTTTTGVAQSFTSQGGSLSQVKFYLRKLGAPVGTAFVRLYASDGGSPSIPTGTALVTATTTLDVSTVTIVLTLYTFNFTPYSLVNGTEYWITLEYYDAGTSSSSHLRVGKDDSSPTDPGNSASLVSGTWTSSTSDLIYYLYSASSTPLLSKLSVTPDATFTDVTNGADTHPFASGDQVKYTVQAGDTLTANTTYYWRVAAIDPSGSNTYRVWSAVWSFTITGGGATGIKVWNGTTWGYKPVKVWNGSAWVAKPVKVWNGSAWVVKG